MTNHAQAALKRLTLAQKIGQLNLLNDTLNIKQDLIRTGGVGGYIVGEPPTDRSRTALLNDLQRIAVEESTHRVPLLFARDVIHGYRTIFPIPLGQAASWNPEAAKRMARSAAVECSADGIKWTYSPMIDIARDPRWGRIAEGYGEDPVLCSRFAVATIEGYQGNSLADDECVAACAKHFVGYAACEGGRDYNTTLIPNSTLREVYLPPFLSAVRAGVATVMAAFNDLNGIPMHQHRHLMREILAKEFGFSGLIVSDWNGVLELLNHGTAGSRDEAALAALVAGIDIDMFAEVYIRSLEHLSAGRADVIGLVDTAAVKTLQLKEQLGLFEKPFTDLKRASKVEISSESRALARAAVAESTILLKNQGEILPLISKKQRIAVVGPLCDDRAGLLGTWSLDGRSADAVSILAGIRAQAGDEITVISPGPYVDAALVESLMSDVVIAVVGEHPCRSGETGSVTSLDLPPGQSEFLRALKRTGVPIISVVIAGRPLVLTDVLECSDAVLFALHPGSEGGNGIADILFDKVNPSARLPFTLPRSTGQVPLYYNAKRTGRPATKYDRFTSRHCDLNWAPLFPFGFGLSYSMYTLSNLQVTPTKLAANTSTEITVDVINSSSRDGIATIQLYIQDIVRSTTPPRKELKDFVRVTLKGGEKKTIKFPLTTEQLSFWSSEEKWCVEPGDFKVLVGLDSEITLEAEIVLK